MPKKKKSKPSKSERTPFRMSKTIAPLLFKAVLDISEKGDTKENFMALLDVIQLIVEENRRTI